MTRIVIYLTNQGFHFFINEVLFVAVEMKGSVMYIDGHSVDSVVQHAVKSVMSPAGNLKCVTQAIVSSQWTGWL